MAGRMEGKLTYVAPSLDNQNSLLRQLTPLLLWIGSTDSFNVPQGHRAHTLWYVSFNLRRERGAGKLKVCATRPGCVVVARQGNPELPGKWHLVPARCLRSWPRTINPPQFPCPSMPVNSNLRYDENLTWKHLKADICSTQHGWALSIYTVLPMNLVLAFRLFKRERNRERGRKEERERGRKEGRQRGGMERGREK